MLRHLSSLLYRQTSGQACVLQRATPIQVHVDAAATVDIYSLEAKLSPPVQRDDMHEITTLNLGFDNYEVTTATINEA